MIRAHSGNMVFDCGDIERRAAAIELPLDSLLKAAQIHRATWYRWKAGDYEPRVQSWRKLEKALSKKEARAAKNGDAP